MSLLSAITSGQLRAGFLIWRCSQSIVVPRRLAQHARFALAAERMEVEGWPVHIRSTGGDLTPQAPGLLNVALAFRCRREKNAIHNSYLALCQPLIEHLAESGIHAECASVPGSFCDGDYNLVVGGRKLAGTAQRWRRLQPEADAAENEFGVLAHAVLLCDEPLDRLWQAANRFYQHCGLPPHVQPECHVALAELRSPSPPHLIETTISGLEAKLTSHLTNL